MAGQFRVRQPDTQMMHGMERLVQQGQRKETATPGVRNDTTGRALGGVAAQADMLNVFPPALQIAGDDSRD